MDTSSVPVGWWRCVRLLRVAQKQSPSCPLGYTGSKKEKISSVSLSQHEVGAEEFNRRTVHHSASSGPPGSSSESQFNKSSSVRTEQSGSPGSWLSSLKFCDRIFHTGLRFLYPVFSLISSGFLSNMAPEYFLKKIYKN